MRTSVFHTVLAVALLGIACSDDANGPVTSFVATLRGTNEIPAVTSTGAASATFSISGTTITYTLTITSAAASAYTVAHIHSGSSATASGTVRVNLCGTGGTVPACPTGAGTVTGTTSTLSGITFDDLVTQMRSYGAYVNVHSATNAGGEIRGEILPAPIP